MIQSPAISPLAAPAALAFAPAAAVRSLTVKPVAAVRSVASRPDLARFADALNQAATYAADSAALRKSWPEDGSRSTPPSAPAGAALAGLETPAPAMVHASIPRATAAAATRAYRAAASRFA